MKAACRFLSVWLTLLAGLGGVFAAEKETAAPDFVLSRRGSAEKVGLADLKGRVVVLDFFAHWCVPCVRCSGEVEAGIRQYYRARHVNARGVSVEVLAINIESARPDKTEAFIKRAGLSEVLDDPQSEVFKSYGGSGLPYIVVVDSTRPNGPVVAYQKAGFEGVAKLRQVIDALGPVPAAPPVIAQPPISQTTARPEQSKETPPAVPSQEDTSRPAAPAASTNAPPQRAEQPPAQPPALDKTAVAGEPTLRHGAVVVHKASLDFATLWASDILLADSLVEYRPTWPRTELTFSISEGHIDLDYVPESLVEQENDVASDRLGFQLNDRFKANERLTLNAGGGAYYGYMDYRSLWLDEHFRQLYSRRAGYIKAHPWGYNAAANARWEYLPASGFVQGGIVFQHDIISPGYDVRLQPFPPRLVRFRDTYDTVSGRLTFENVLTARLRAQEELLITDTTDRHLRFSLQGSLNAALAEHWVGRLAVSGTKENPQFEAWYVSAVLERDWNETWFVSLMGRYYQDTGQIENALLAENTAAPPLRAVEAGLGLRWQGASSSVKVTVGPYFTHYDPPTAAQASFGHLYQGRDWLSAQFAFSHEF